MKAKHLVICSVTALLVGAISFAAGYAAAPDSPAHLLARTAEEWTALAAWVAVAIAGGTAVIALQQMFEARRLRIDQAQPQVVAYLEQDPDIPDVIEIVIGNFGTTAARDVKVSTSAPVRATSGADPDSDPEVLALPERFATLAPGQRWRTAWDFGSTRAEHRELATENRVRFSFDYLGVDGKPVHYDCDLDWAEVGARWWAKKRNVHHVAGALEAISKTLAEGLVVARRRSGRPDAAAPTAAQPASAPATEPAPAEGKVAELYRRFMRGR